MKRVSNGLGVALLSSVMAVTPLTPVAGSAPPQWEWDSSGKVYDRTGQYRSMTDEEVCATFGWCKKDLPDYPDPERGTADSGGGSC